MTFSSTVWMFTWPYSAPAAVLGLDGGGVAFYRIEVPPVDDNQLDSIVRMQAESLLPLPADQMQMTWRAASAVDGKRSCSIAAARSDQLRRFVSDAGDGVSQILLDAEAVVKAWMELFNGTIEKSVLINLRANDCRVLLADEGRLAHAVTLDVGLSDLSGDESASNYELFVHDLRNALELFGEDVSQQTNVLVISENDRAHERLVSYLNEAGFDARAASPSSQRLRYSESSEGDDVPGIAIVEDAEIAGSVTGGDICQYIEPIGLALMAMDGDGAELNLFDGLVEKSDPKAKAKVAHKIQLAFLITAIIAVVCLVAAKAVDKALLERVIDPELNKLVEQQKMRQQIAAHRPDILGLLKAVNESGLSGMMLDSFEYKAGKVTIAGFARSREQMFEFQKKLEENKEIGPVDIPSSPFDEKKKGVNFKMQFEYKK